MQYELNVNAPTHADIEHGVQVGGRTADVLATCEQTWAVDGRSLSDPTLRLWSVGTTGAVAVDGGGIKLFVGEETRNCNDVNLYRRQVAIGGGVILKDIVYFRSRFIRRKPRVVASRK